MVITATELVSDEGTVLLFGGTAENGEHVTFAVDHRPGWPLVEALDELGEVAVEVEDWAVL